MTPQERRDEIEKLINSAGWTVLKEEMERSILQAAYQLCDNSNMPPEEMHFRRGSMWAARKFIDLPNAVSAILLNDVLLETASKEQPTDPAKAGL